MQGEVGRKGCRGEVGEEEVQGEAGRKGCSEGGSSAGEGPGASGSGGTGGPKAGAAKRFRGHTGLRSQARILLGVKPGRPRGGSTCAAAPRN